MPIRLIIDLDNSVVQDHPYVGTPNRIANAGIEILRLPIPNTRVSGAYIGEPVKALSVLQYVGPATLTVVADVETKTKASKPKRMSRKRPNILRSKSTSRSRKKGFSAKK